MNCLDGCQCGRHKPPANAFAVGNRASAGWQLNPEWRATHRAACTVANRKLAADPKWRMANHVAAITRGCHQRVTALDNELGESTASDASLFDLFGVVQASMSKRRDP